MNKFQKRLSKNMKKSPIHCVVVGNGFGHIDDFLELFNTVFLLESTLDMKAINLISREETQGVFNLSDVGAVFLDYDKKHMIDSLSPLLSKQNPDVFIEKDDVIEREYSKVLYQLRYRAIAQLGGYHQWSVMP
jgi:hypothetical protein